MAWRPTHGPDGFTSEFAPEDVWLWVWGPSFPGVLPAQLRDIGGAAFWFGKSNRKIHAELITYWHQGPVEDEDGNPIEPPSPPE